ncbi:hypothetical protein CASFOL_023382 [Castilleja foliolosa]|uniref:Glabrous enhancer-binding protein-like DBD domain-containing protein n=1 Tax=Castilleja foliolosa TaxID=1961234 RepID=A0ABD3CKE4_9LAMI
MARKREPEKPVQYESDSSDEEDSSSEEASSDSDPDLTQVTKKPSSSTPAAAKKPKPPSASKPVQKPPSSSEDESESESESDSDGPDPKLNSIATKNPTNDSKKSKSKPSSEDPVTPRKSAAGKRPAEEKAPDAKDAKKLKKAEPEASENTPAADRVPFQRLWSEEDEIAILQGLIDYATVKKADPLTDLGAFHDFIKKNLHVEVSKNQLHGKIKTLKRKYKNNNIREKKEGKPRTFTKPHEQKTYELSKSIWGNEMVKDNRVQNGIVSPEAKGASLSKRAYAADKEEPKALGGDILPMKKSEMDWGSMEKRILTTGDKLFEDGYGDEEAKQWSKLKMEEMELYVRYMEVKTLQARVVYERLKSEMK